MAGEAQTTQFNVSSATLMLGEMGHGLDLTPELHSVGLVKDVSISVTKERIELGQGITNDTVDSQVTGNTTSVSANVYEYTAKNLAYAAGIDGREMKAGKAYKLAAALNPGATTATITSDIDISSEFAEGQDVMIQAKNSGADDHVALLRVASSNYVPPSGGSKASGTITLTEGLGASEQVNVGAKAFVAGTTFQLGETLDATAENLATAIAAADAGVTATASGAVVTVEAESTGTEGNAITLHKDGEHITLSGNTLSGGADGTTHGSLTITFKTELADGFSFEADDVLMSANYIPVASNEETPYLSAKITMVLPNEKDPVVMVMQKVRVTNGFAIASTQNDYGSMPFELTPYMPLPSDGAAYDRKRKARILLFKK